MDKRGGFAHSFNWYLREIRDILSEWIFKNLIGVSLLQIDPSIGYQ